MNALVLPNPASHLLVRVDIHIPKKESVFEVHAEGVLVGLVPPELLTRIRQLGHPVDCRGNSCVWSEDKINNPLGRGKLKIRIM